MYKAKRVSLILPTYNEKDSIRKVIQDFEELEFVDEILVINNNAIDGTSTEVHDTSAIEIHESVQGYGAAIQRGLREATGDLIAVCEPDDTFLARDLTKFLAYAEDVDIVYGSRTVRTFIWNRANMGLLLRWGNWFVAKLLEILFSSGTKLPDFCVTGAGLSNFLVGPSCPPDYFTAARLPLLTGKLGYSSFYALPGYQLGSNHFSRYLRGQPQPPAGVCSGALPLFRAVVRSQYSMVY